MMLLKIIVFASWIVSHVVILKYNLRVIHLIWFDLLCIYLNLGMFTDHDAAWGSHVLHWNFSIPRVTTWSVNIHLFIPDLENCECSFKSLSNGVDTWTWTMAEKIFTLSIKIAADGNLILFIYFISYFFRVKNGLFGNCFIQMSVRKKCYCEGDDLNEMSSRIFCEK